MKKVIKKIYYSFKFFLKSLGVVKENIDVYVTTSKDDLNAIFAQRYKVYCYEKKYLDKNKYKDSLEKDEYDKTSIHFIAKNKKGDVVGSSRLILSNNLQLDKYTTIPSGVERDSLAEVSRLIVDKKYRGKGHEVSFAITKKMLEYSIENGIKHWFAVDFVLTWKIFNRTRVPFIMFDTPKDWHHMPGFLLMPVIMHLDDLVLYLKCKSRFLYRYFFKSIPKELLVSALNSGKNCKEIVSRIEKDLKNDWEKYKHLS